MPRAGLFERSSAITIVLEIIARGAIIICFIAFRMDGPQIPNKPPNSTITTAQFAAKFRSKREGKLVPAAQDISSPIFVVYTFLTVDVKAYLPPIHTITIYFLKGK